MSFSMPRLMDWPLKGISLVEASAGTGKTWTITGLYLRLVLEAGLPVERILVVTYTEAATAELRDRIRKRLAEALRAFQCGSSEDELCHALLVRNSDPTQAIYRLERAISCFDLAAIYTIHGFCRRVLAETAFESNARFDTEVLVSEQELLAAICDDFWRREILSQPADVVEHLLQARMTPDDRLGRWAATTLQLPFVTLLQPEPEPAGSYETARREGVKALSHLRTLWPDCRDEVRGLLCGAALNKKSYPPDAVDAWLDGVERLLSRPGLHWDLPEKFDRFLPGAINRAVKKGETPPSHPFFDACDRYHAAYGAFNNFMTVRGRRLKSALNRFVTEELRQRKEQSSCHSFNDLLLLVRDALRDARGGKLAEYLRSRYKAAMIDEFQDTDPVQLEIFERIYDTDGAPRFLVGDPKQAIYSFRGADLFAYLKGRARAKHSHTLDTNHRSAPGLVQAVNALFQGHGRPFVFERLPYAVVSGQEKNARRLLEEGGETAPLRFSFLPREKDGKLFAKGLARELVRQDVAAEIVRLLECAARGTLLLDERKEDDRRPAPAGNGLPASEQKGLRPVACGDIAVLVRGHRQAREIEQALARSNVPSVRHGTDNLFASDEATDMETVLRAVLEPGSERLVRAALATGMIGFDAHDLGRLTDSAMAWDNVAEQFRQYHEQWREHGFMPMLQRLQHDFQTLPRLLRMQSGERAVTNLRHLAELLQARAATKNRSMHSLVRWLAAMRRARENQQEEALLRLESDAKRVKIVTMHKAKGLEYPIVFCPYLWDGSLHAAKVGNDEVAFHDPDDDFNAYIDLGSEKLEQHREQALKEELAESVRLLYVALTRAKYRCYVHWGAVNDFATSPLAWLLHGGGNDMEHPVAALKTDVLSYSDERMRQRLAEIAAAAGGGIAVRECVLPADAPVLTVAADRQEELPARRRCDRVLRPSWQVTSFTGLVRSHWVEERDRDAVLFTPPDGVESPERQTIFTFPRGKRTGNCWHGLFEQLDFPSAGGEALREAVRSALRQGGFDLSWEQPVCDMVRHTLDAVLDETTGLRLAVVSRERRLPEMEFFFTLRDADAAGLQKLLARYGGQSGKEWADAMARLSIATVSGFLHGFIDLALEHGGRYYLIDYKSNHLGNRSTVYGPEQLAGVMLEEHYFLQFLLYTVALHRYLRLRLPGYSYEKHFGGVCYLFLRGIEQDHRSRNGIYFQRPRAELIERLDQWFGNGGPHG